MKETRDIMTDCFAYKNDNECTALIEMYCTKKKCPFYLTREEYLKKTFRMEYKNTKI